MKFKNKNTEATVCSSKSHLLYFAYSVLYDSFWCYACAPYVKHKQKQKIFASDCRLNIGTWRTRPMVLRSTSSPRRTPAQINSRTIKHPQPWTVMISKFVSVTLLGLDLVRPRATPGPGTTPWRTLGPWAMFCRDSGELENIGIIPERALAVSDGWSSPGYYV